ncbi:MAG: hypothetical protein OHK0012_12910 [Synechococcales cyanobacterium]
MATLIPVFHQCSARMTSGERRLAQVLQDVLDDDYWIWYDIPLGVKRRHPDFLILHPRQGLIVVEVKDWSLDTLQQLDPETATILTATGTVKTANPLRQARDYVLTLVNLLKRDPELVFPVASPHAGQLQVPYGYGVFLAGIRRQDFQRLNLGDVLDDHLVICKDELRPADIFQERLLAFLPYRFQQSLSEQQRDRIRWHLFPEIRIIAQQPSLFATVPESMPSSDVIRVMDLQQEQLARSLGEGHRVIHGVAGSGKTMILTFRCQYLAAVVNKPILVLCFNVALSAKLSQVIGEKLPAAAQRRKVVVKHFHK